MLTQTPIRRTFETLTEAMDAFQLYARIEGRSRKTLEVYETAFSDLLDWLGNDRPLTDPYQPYRRGRKPDTRVRFCRKYHVKINL
ncbi:MAG: hypothetical protein RMJ29_08905 [Candidatus Bipolaricaulota bacterium]|nr:hypothetical protein [Candidatus Bipolaricaulota bacterium]